MEVDPAVKICYLWSDRGIRLGRHQGASVNFHTTVRTFLDLGHDVLVVTSSPDGEPPPGAAVVRVPSPEISEDLLRRACAAEREFGRRVHALAHIWHNVAVEQVLADVLPRYAPDLLLERYSPFGVAGGLMASRLGITHLLNVHAPLAWEGAHFRRQAMQEAAEFLESAAFSTAGLLVTVSRELRDQLIAAGVPAGKIEVVPNGVDIGRFGPAGPVWPGRPEGRCVVGFVSSLRPWHGVDLLIEGFRTLARDPRYHLLVVGDGPMMSDLRRLADELPGRLTLTGAVPQTEVPAYTRAMDAALVPYPAMRSFYFSPLKVLEYMAAGCAIVASAIGQVNELIADGRTGLLVPPGDVPALVDAVRRLAGDQALRARLGCAAAAEARRRHSAEQRAREMLGLVEAHA
jgi:glycosyltransferase involved in cell wall biosynthesis